MKVVYSREAKKQLKIIQVSNAQLWRRVKHKIVKIAEWTEIKERLQWFENHYKARVGKYRIIYSYENDVLVIVITVMKRGKVYKKKS